MKFPMYSPSTSPNKACFYFKLLLKIGVVKCFDRNDKKNLKVQFVLSKLKSNSYHMSI